MKIAGLPLHIAVGVVYDAVGNVLIARRASHQHQGGLWEFPGGKVNRAEEIPQALCRELYEELGIVPLKFSRLITLPFDYKEYSVVLHVFEVQKFSGKVFPREEQPLKWVPVSELKNHDFPAANRAIITRLTLPDLYKITPPLGDEASLKNDLTLALHKNIRMIQFRSPNMPDSIYLSMAEKFSGLTKVRDASLLIKGSINLLSLPWCQGLHLTTEQLMNLNKEKWSYHGRKWLAASCHNIAELRAAEKTGCHFVTMSPVHQTTSHPHVKPMGFDTATRLTAAASLPVFWLGGMTFSMLNRVRSSGGQGISGISAFCHSAVSASASSKKICPQ